MSASSLALSVAAALGTNRHTFGTIPAQTRHARGGNVDREGGGFSPTLGWGAAVDSSERGVGG